jgi:hypothetical protein
MAAEASIANCSASERRIRCFISVAMLPVFVDRGMKVNGKNITRGQGVCRLALCNAGWQAQRLIDGAISASGPPVSSDIRLQLFDFQAVAFDLHLVKPDLYARCMAAAIQGQTVAVLVQLEFLPMQPLLIRAKVRR